jgi:DnaK suppressor protein
MPKKTNKKTAVKKTSAKAAPKKKSVKKAAAKKITPKKVVKKAAAKKAAPKKTVKKKTVKKAAAKKTVKKAAPKKTALKKVTAKKSASAKSSKTTKSKPTTKLKRTVSTKKSAAAKTTKKTSAKAAKQKEVEVISPSKKVKKIKGYNKADLEQFKQVILDKREEIIEQLQNLKDQMMDPTTGQYVNESSPYSLHMAEQGTDAQEREKLYLWAQRENKFLGYLEDALQRIENGTYGICIDCIDEPKNLCPTCPLVPKDRLMAVPHTQHCLQVKQTMRKS